MLIETLVYFNSNIRNNFFLRFDQFGSERYMFYRKIYIFAFQFNFKPLFGNDPKNKQRIKSKCLFAFGPSFRPQYRSNELLYYLRVTNNSNR